MSKKFQSFHLLYSPTHSENKQQNFEGLDLNVFEHGLRTPREEVAFTARPKTQSQSQIFRYGGSIFSLPHRPNFSDIFDLCCHRVSVVRANKTVMRIGPLGFEIPDSCILWLLHTYVWIRRPYENKTESYTVCSCVSNFALQGSLGRHQKLSIKALLIWAFVILLRYIVGIF